MWQTRWTHCNPQTFYRAAKPKRCKGAGKFFGPTSSSLAARWVSAAARGEPYAAGEASMKAAAARGTLNATSALCHSRSPGRSAASAGGSGNADGVVCAAKPMSVPGAEMSQMRARSPQMHYTMYARQQAEA